MLLNIMHGALSVLLNIMHGALSVLLNIMHGALSVLLNIMHGALSVLLNIMHGALLCLAFYFCDVAGCCHAWESKALRAASGAHFCLDIVEGVEWESIYCRVSQQPTVYLADICNRDREPPLGAGEQEEEDDATSIEKQLLLQRQLREERKRLAKSASQGEQCVQQLEVSCDEEGNERLVDASLGSNEILKQFAYAELPSVDYKAVGFYPTKDCLAQGEVVLVVGSERGLTNASKKFALDNYGHKISIPLHNNVESLNTSVASGIIMYEIHNQYREACKKFNDERSDQS